jgi:acyl carrier protein
MTISSRTPEGEPHRCAICGGLVVTEPSQPLGDSVCPRCGALLFRFHETFTDQLGIDRERVTAETDLKQLGADSLDVVELVMELEEQFDINIPDDEAEKIQTVADAIRAILRRRNQLPGDRKPEE